MQRYFCWAVAIVSALAVAISLATEFLWGWRPCYLCITQRALFAAMVAAALVWARWETIGRGLCGLLSLGGLTVASGQLYVQHTATDAVCGGGAPNMLERTIEWLAEHVGSFFEVTGFCTDPYPVLGIPMAGWAVVLFGCFFISTVYPRKVSLN